MFSCRAGLGQYMPCMAMHKGDTFSQTFSKQWPGPAVHSHHTVFRGPAQARLFSAASQHA